MRWKNLRLEIKRYQLLLKFQSFRYPPHFDMIFSASHYENPSFGPSKKKNEDEKSIRNSIYKKISLRVYFARGMSSHGREAWVICDKSICPKVAPLHRAKRKTRLGEKRDERAARKWGETKKSKEVKSNGTIRSNYLSVQFSLYPQHSNPIYTNSCKIATPTRCIIHKFPQCIPSSEVPRKHRDTHTHTIVKFIFLPLCHFRLVDLSYFRSHTRSKFSCIFQPNSLLNSPIYLKKK